MLRFVIFWQNQQDMKLTKLEQQIPPQPTSCAIQPAVLARWLQESISGAGTY